ncbi:MAG: bifunctional phosphoglucose/phosphomannose isomerase [Candidatus Paceibacterota bacterium]
MEDAIKNFSSQFSFVPEIKNTDSLKQYKKFVLAGMGGSHLAGGILRTARPEIDLVIYQNYGIPAFAESEGNETLFIASSYSGNTEEVIDFAEKVHEQGFPLAIIAVGGKLLEFAKEKNIPYIAMPDTGIQPRSALGYSLLSLLKIIGRDDLVADISSLSEILDVEAGREEGARLAEALRGKVPVIYASAQNHSIAYNWKIKCNETGKVPAFYNVFPELNHNELAGMDVLDSTRGLSSKLHFILICDSADHPRVAKRMEILEELYQARGLSVTRLFLEGSTPFERIFRSLILADWTALHLANIYGAEPDQVRIIEEFKKKITE